MKLGIADKYFYYSGINNSTFEARYVMSLKDALNIALFKEALKITADLYPEFRRKIVVKNNRFDCVKNDLYPVIFNDTDSHKYFTEEVNYYNYFFTYSDETKELTFNTCHGLADAFSAIRFCTCVFYHYALSLGDKFSDEEINELKNRIRFSSEEAEGIDEGLMYDPYSKLYDSYKKPHFSYFCKDVYHLEYPMYDKDADCMHLYEIRLKTSEFIKITNSLDTSFASLFIYAVSKSICENNVMDGKPVVAMLPVDFRRVFDTNTMVNFSDGIGIPFEYSDIDAERENVLKKIKEYISKQLTKENLAEIMALKIKLISALENNIDDIDIIFKRFKSILSKDNPKSSTYTLSYPGVIDFGRHLNNYISDFNAYAYTDDCGCYVCSYGENLNVMIGLKSDDKSFPEGICSEFKKLGLTAKLTDHGKIRVNAMDIRDLER